MEVQWPLLIFSVFLGISSGIFVFLGAGEIKGKFKEVRFIGALIAFLLVAIGGCISVLHMGHPERATHLLGNLGSGLTKELFATAAMGIIAFVYLILARKDYPMPSKILGIAGGVVGIILPIITGASYLMMARPAWDSITLPLMYLGAGLAGGIILMCALVLLRGNAKDDGGFALRLALAGVIIMVITSLAYVLWIALAPYQAPSRSIERLVSGDLALAFWGGVVVCGLVIPTALVVLACIKGTKGDEGSGLTDPSKLAIYLIVALAGTVVGSVALRVIMYAVGTSVEQFIYQ